MSSYSGRGEAYIENVNISNVTAEKAGKCISIESPVAGGVKNVSISNFRAYCFASVMITAKEKGMVEGLNFTDMHIISQNADYPVGNDERGYRGDYIIYAENVGDLTFTNPKMEIEEDYPGKWLGVSKFENCDRVTINGGNL